MALWVDKHRPKTLDTLDFHRDVSERLKGMVQRGDFPHLLVYGPSGAGKKTRILALLREAFGGAIEKLKVEHRTWKVPSSSVTVDYTTVSSTHHMEMNPSDVGVYDRVIVQEVIKEFARSQALDAVAYKVVVLHEVDRMSHPAQAALRRTMEKYVESCRFILVCNSTSKVIDPIKSRCLGIRVPAPAEPEIVDVLKKICKKEGISLPDELAARIAAASDQNLRRAILSLEATKVKQYPFQPNQKIDQSDWELFVMAVAKEIMDDQSPKTLLSVRTKFYELLSHCIPPELIMKRLLLELLNKLDAQLKPEVVELAAQYEHRMQLGTKPIYHLEAFVAKFMSLYRKFIVETFAAM